MELSGTSEEEKSLVLVEGGLHDLITNEMIFLTSTSITWIDKQLDKKKEEKKMKK